MRNALPYRDPLSGRSEWLMKGSLAYELAEKNDPKLKGHMKRLAYEAAARGDVPLLDGGPELEG